MSKLNLEPTKPNILETLKNNYIGRNKLVLDFITKLDSSELDGFISLDEEWGNGKTFFVKQVEYVMKYHYMKMCGTLEDLDQDIKESIEYTNLNNIEISSLMYPVYFNAWANDNKTDPLLSLIFSIIKDTKAIVSTGKQKSISNLFKDIFGAMNIKSIDIGRVIEAFDVKNIFETIKTTEEIMDLTKNIFEQITYERCDKLVVIIDELDRCRPTFAVELLERLKHYFDNEKITFILALNKTQLIHTISKCYGDGFDATRYLNKFFTNEYNLYKINWSEYYHNFKYNNKILKYVIEIGNTMGLSIRDMNIAICNLEKIDKIINSNIYSKREYLVLISFVPVILIIKNYDIMFYNNIIQGKAWDELKNIIKHIDYIGKIFYCNNQDNYNKPEKYLSYLQTCYYYIFTSKTNEFIAPYELDISKEVANLIYTVCL